MSAKEKTREALGQSDVFLMFQERLSEIAQVDRPVVLVGERGTGKELAAARLHYLSKRWQAPLITVNCAALSPSLMESELFGHEAGAFTGAAEQRSGRFEAADGGTLFLDEIGLVPIPVQEKILRVVEYGCFERVGSSSPIETDVRIIAATNADLPKMAREGAFKQDLLDRLSFDVLALPPLRERQDDIPLLAYHFAAAMAQELGLATVPEFTPEAMAAMCCWPWPGNVRELKNCVERVVYRSKGAPIDHIVFDPFPIDAPMEPQTPATHRETTHDTEPTRFVVGRQTLKEATRALERDAVRAALEHTRFHQGRAADLLGLTYDQFRGLYRKYQSELYDSE